MNFWIELEIEPTKDEKAIKRAYAVKLKKIDREKNLEEFQKLRQAYEKAVAYSKQEFIAEINFNTSSDPETIDLILELDNIDLTERIESQEENETYEYSNALKSVNQLLSSLSNSSLSAERIRANEITKGVILIWKEKGETQALKEWAAIEVELREETIAFTEEVSASFVDELREFYSELEERNPDEFPVHLLEKVFHFFDWDNAAYNIYYSLSQLKRRISARKARIEIEKNSKLTPLLESYDPKKMTRDKKNFSTYLIQRYILQLEKNSPEIFEYELDLDTVDYWREERGGSGIWKYVGLLIWVVSSYYGIHSEGMIYKTLLFSLAFLFMPPILYMFSVDYILFYEKIIYFIRVEKVKEKTAILGLILSLVFVETFALTSMIEINLKESFFVFLRVLVFLLLSSPVIESIIHFLFNIYSRLESFIQPPRVEFWYAGYFVLFVFSVIFQIENSSRFEVALLVWVVLGFYSLSERKNKDDFFGEVYTTLLLSPLAAYFLLALFGLKDFTLMANSIMFMIAFSNFGDYLEEKRKKTPRFLVGAMIGIAIVSCFITNPFPSLDIVHKIFLFVTLFFGYCSLTLKHEWIDERWIFVWIIITFVGICASTLLRSFWFGNPGIFAVLCQLILINLWMTVNQIYYIWKGKKLFG